MVRGIKEQLIDFFVALSYTCSKYSRWGLECQSLLLRKKKGFLINKWQI